MAQEEKYLIFVSNTVFDSELPPWDRRHYLSNKGEELYPANYTKNIKHAKRFSEKEAESMTARLKSLGILSWIISETEILIKEIIE